MSFASAAGGALTRGFGRKRRSAATRHWLFFCPHRSIKDEHVGGMDLGDTVRAPSTFNVAVAQPAADVNQAVSSAVSRNELARRSMTISVCQSGAQSSQHESVGTLKRAHKRPDSYEAK